MTFKRCKNCNKGFTPQSSGRMSLLCFRCCSECDKAFPLILDFLQENKMPFHIVDKDIIAEATCVSDVFIWVLAKEGCFGSLDKKNCTRCFTQLLPDERDVCSKCATIISQQLQIALMWQKADPGARLPDPGQAAGTDSGGRSSKKYGLGRKD